MPIQFNFQRYKWKQITNCLIRNKRNDLIELKNNEMIGIQNATHTHKIKFRLFLADLFKFTCPKVDENTAATHPRYADPDDCQFFYVCINGEQPRRNGCKLGQAFDDVTKRCDWARKVPEW